MIKKVFAGLVLASAMGLDCNALAQETSIVYITTFSCVSGAAVAPTLEVAALDNASLYREEHAAVKKMARGVYRLTFVSTRIHFWAIIRAGDCGTKIPVSVMPGHSRSLLAFPTRNRVMAISARHWIAGCVVPGVQSALLTRAYKPQAAAAIDNGCYDFEYVGGGDFIVRFEVSPGIMVDVPVTVPAHPPESGKIVNLSLDQIVKGAQL